MLKPLNPYDPIESILSRKMIYLISQHEVGTQFIRQIEDSSKVIPNLKLAEYKAQVSTKLINRLFYVLLICVLRSLVCLVAVRVRAQIDVGRAVSGCSPALRPRCSLHCFPRAGCAGFPSTSQLKH